MTPLLRVRDLKVHFTGRDAARSTIKAVDGVSFDLAAGRTLALVGESGCGKSTTAYAIVGMESPTSGTIHFDGQDITRLEPRARRALATEMAIVFQDPSAALDPKMSVAESILEPLAIQGSSRARQRTRLAELLDRVGLPAAYATRTPNALSGGQKQRVVIARALALSPRLLVLDEPVSALDVSIRSQILNLLMELQHELGLAYLFISHDLSVVRHLADDTMVMYLGTVAEQGYRCSVRRRAPSLHPGPAVGHSPARPGGAAPARQDHPLGRPAQPARTTTRMPVRQPLPDTRGAVRRGPPDAGAGRHRPAHRLPGPRAVSQPGGCTCLSGGGTGRAAGNLRAPEHFARALPGSS